MSVHLPSSFWGIDQPPFTEAQVQGMAQAVLGNKKFAGGSYLPPAFGVFSPADWVVLTVCQLLHAEKCNSVSISESVRDMQFSPAYSDAEKDGLQKLLLAVVAEVKRLEHVQEPKLGKGELSDAH